MKGLREFIEAWTGAEGKVCAFEPTEGPFPCWVETLAAEIHSWRLDTELAGIAWDTSIANARAFTELKKAK